MIDQDPDATVDLGALWDQHVEQQQDGGAPAPAPAVPATAPMSDESGRARDEAGRFAPKADDAAPATPAAPTAQPDPTKPADPAAAPVEAPQADAAAAPPKGWSPAAKASWDALPPDVRAAVAKREEEMSVGMRRYEGMARWAEVAEKQGVSLAQKAEYYTNAENFIERDLVGAVLWMAGNQRMTPEQLLQGLTARLQGGRQPGGQPQPQHAGPAMAPADPRDLVRETLQQERDIEATNAFFSDPANRYAENLRPLMATLISGGQVPAVREGKPLKAILSDAYDMACQADPQVRAAIAAARPQSAAAPAASSGPSRADQAAAARRRTGSITGSPLPAGQSRDPNATQRQVDSELYDTLVG